MASPDDSPGVDPVEDHIKSMDIKSGNTSDDGEHTASRASGGNAKADSPSSGSGSGSDAEKPVKLEQGTLSGAMHHRPAAHQSRIDDWSDEEADEAEAVVGGDVLFKQEPGQPPKLERKASQKVTVRHVQLFNHLDNSTDEAKSTFQLLEDCTYASKSLGFTEHAMDCDCAEEWDAATSMNLACGEDSDCINRATKMECVKDCGCGENCQNQRFQRRLYANIAIIKTEKKGYGVRAEEDLSPGQFIFEYIGEVINERDFRKRMVKYDEEGIKHFYFMSLNKGEFVDATKRGNLGRFCNHSCNPNCYVDKWVVGDKLRMGIFAERKIRKGEELVFNYNVDRYGADPQPCYCGEPNCTGFIGGKTQTERATKLPLALLEALGIDDGDGWDTTVAKRPRKKRQGEDDEQWVDSLQPMPLDEDGVTKVMAALMQCKEKWIAVKLLDRIQRCDESSVRNRVIRMHGYQILKTAIATFREDVNVVLQILEILDSFPRVTRNKIADAKIEDVIIDFKEHEHEDVAEISSRLLTEWAKLEIAYRIPRVKRDPNAKRIKKEEDARREREGRRRKSRSRSRSRSPPLDAPKGPAVPTGPKNAFAQRASFPRPFRPPPKPLPAGWHSAFSDGRTYYYTSSGQTQWVRPTTPAITTNIAAKQNSQQKALDDIIAGIERDNAKKAEEAKASAISVSQTPQKKESSEKKDRKPKWMSYDEAKQKKLYENTIHPHIKYVVDKYKSRLPKDSLKENFKALSKKFVESDFRKNRVPDPTKIDEKKQRDIKKYTKEYFDKLLVRHRDHEKKKQARLAAKSKMAVKDKDVNEISETSTPLQDKAEERDESDAGNALDGSGDEEERNDSAWRALSPQTPLESSNGDGPLKRKRPSVQAGVNGTFDAKDTDTEPETSPNKRMRSATPPPPPPPPPPAEDMPSEEPNLVEIEGVSFLVATSRAEEEQYDEDRAPPPPASPPPASLVRSESMDQMGQYEVADGDGDSAEGGAHEDEAMLDSSSLHTGTGRSQAVQT